MGLNRDGSWSVVSMEGTPTGRRPRGPRGPSLEDYRRRQDAALSHHLRVISQVHEAKYPFGGTHENQSMTLGEAAEILFYLRRSDDEYLLNKAERAFLPRCKQDNLPFFMGIVLGNFWSVVYHLEVFDRDRRFWGEQVGDAFLSCYPFGEDRRYSLVSACYYSKADYEAQKRTNTRIVPRLPAITVALMWYSILPKEKLKAGITEVAKFPMREDERDTLKRFGLLSE
jgi:hypothetical protein